MKQISVFGLSPSDNPLQELYRKFREIPQLVKMMRPIVEVQKVTFSYNRERVLEEVDLTLHQGEFLGLIGPNGSGKSTLIKCILGLQKPYSGEIYLFGKPVSRFHEWAQVGYVSQKASGRNANFPATVFEIVSSGLYGKLGLFKWMSRKDKEVVYDIIDCVGLSGLHKRMIGDLSGGQQQRVFVARALVSNPSLLILDEPAVGVDVKSVERLYNLLKDLQGKNDLTILLVSHDIDTMISKVSKVVCLNKRVHFQGDAEVFALHKEDILSRVFGYTSMSG